MMKKSLKIIFTIFCFFAVINFTHAETLKELKDQLARDEANKNANIQKQKDYQKKISAAKNEIAGLEADIEKYQNEIDELVIKIDELNAKIAEKRIEIDNLLSFLQVSNGDNVYLEYIFQSKSFTDFIYRSAVVEQLTEYNDELIDEMYNMIEEAKRLQEELKGKIEANQKSIEALEKKLNSFNVSLRDLENAHTDIEADIKARKQTISYYEQLYKANDCPEDKDLIECITNTPNATGFVRPLSKGSVSSEWGYRNCPVHGRELHSGIDIAVAMETPVYAAAMGTVSGITRKSKCGGNQVTINHIIKGKQYRTVYMHLASINVSMGQLVDITTVIGKSGGGGYTLKKNGGWDTCSTGAHLHFTIKTGWSGGSTVNPRSFVNFPAKGRSFSGRW